MQSENPGRILSDAEQAFRQAMSIAPIDQRQAALLSASEALRRELEQDGAELKELILSQPPLDLLGYVWGHLPMLCTLADEEQLGGKRSNEIVAEVSTLLEYCHAAWSCFTPTSTQSDTLEQSVVQRIELLVERIRELSMLYCMASSQGSDASFGDETGQVEFFAKSTWVSIRGNRYQPLEREFFAFVMRPHDSALRECYCIGSNALAEGIQSITDSMRIGFSDAAERLFEQMNATDALAKSSGVSQKEAVALQHQNTPDFGRMFRNTFDDMFYGGVCNLSKHTSLPRELLRDLAFQRAENTEFFQPGFFSGTLFRTLPARIKPLINLTGDFYAVDPSFVRDAAYRAIQRGLLRRLPNYREEWNKRQKKLTECSFTDIFAHQFRSATKLTDIYYPDAHGQWAEADGLVLHDDVLIAIEAKAGVAALHSPATDFAKHVRAIRDLVVKAYEQTKRFCSYLSSAPSVPLFHRRDGQFVKVEEVQLTKFRCVLPIGLTVESFTPFSAMCKELPDVEPLLGKFPFMSMSIDDLLVLNRFLPTAGQLLHYLEVRQRVAGIKKAFLFDEMDHLGAYISRNRFDLEIQQQLRERHRTTWDGFSQDVDEFFTGERWLTDPPPSQELPPRVGELLEALERTALAGWLRADSAIRDLASDAKQDIHRTLDELIPTLARFERRRMILGFKDAVTLLVWIAREQVAPRTAEMIRQAAVAALATDARSVLALHVAINDVGAIASAFAQRINRPLPTRGDYSTLVREADVLKGQLRNRI